MSQRGKRLVIVGVIIALGAAITACSTRAPSDGIVLYYTAGPGEDRHFQECIQPGTSGSFPMDDEIFELPTSLRTWTIATEGGDTNTPITSGSLPAADLSVDGKPTGTTRPGAEVTVWGPTDFYINTDCTGGATSPVVQFWEKSGRRPWKDGKGISTDGEGNFNEDGWREMLRNTLVIALQAAVRAETRKYTADDMDANTNGVWTVIQRQAGPELNRILREKVGGDYFCGPEYQRGNTVEWTEYQSDGVDDKGLAKFREVKKTGTCPPVRLTITDINFANLDIAKSRADVFAAEQKAKAALIDATSKAEVAAKLEGIGNSATYIELERIKAQFEAAAACRANANCTVIIDGSSRGAGLTVAGR